MSNYDETNRGAIWGNDKKEKDTHPDLRGQANIDGVEYWVSAWKRKPGDNPKSPALRFAFTKKEDVHNQGMKQARQAANPPPQQPAQSSFEQSGPDPFDGFDDDILF